MAPYTLIWKIQLTLSVMTNFHASPTVNGAADSKSGKQTPESRNIQRQSIKGKLSDKRKRIPISVNMSV